MTDQEKQDVQKTPSMPLVIHAQYIKDLSFENPNAPDTLRTGQEPPQMDININIDVRRIEDENIESLYEVILELSASAKQPDRTVFLAELSYGATVSLNDVPEKNHHPILFVEVPRSLFPFARQIMSDVTQQGGYPPLMLNPVDFHGMYMTEFSKDKKEAVH